jgi:hypothetical protein
MVRVNRSLVKRFVSAVRGRSFLTSVNDTHANFHTRRHSVFTDKTSMLTDARRILQEPSTVYKI